MALFRFYCTTIEGVVQVQTFIGNDWLHMIKCGTLAMPELNWQDFRRQVLNKANPKDIEVIDS